MADKKTESIELYEADAEYLRQMVAKHGLADISKAIRCLINFSRDEKSREAEIFETIRCHHC